MFDPFYIIHHYFGGMNLEIFSKDLCKRMEGFFVNFQFDLVSISTISPPQSHTNQPNLLLVGLATHISVGFFKQDVVHQVSLVAG